MSDANPKSADKSVAGLQRPQGAPYTPATVPVTSLREAIAETNTQMRAFHQETVARMTSDTTRLQEAIAETNSHMRMLHEEALARIATVGEGRKRGRER